MASIDCRRRGTPHLPALVGLGIAPIVANATSTVALWPASVSGMFGYREELEGALALAGAFALPSLIGGAVAGSRVAQRVGQRGVRLAIIVIGLGSGLVMLAVELRR